MITESEAFAAGYHGLWAKAGTVPMKKGHSRLEFEVSRFLNPAQNVPSLFPGEGRKIGLLPHEIDKAAKYA
jgi:hypothetical protein